MNELDYTYTFSICLYGMHRDNFNDLETLSCAGGRPPEGNMNFITNCLWEISRKRQLGECC